MRQLVFLLALLPTVCGARDWQVDGRVSRDRCGAGDNDQHVCFRQWFSGHGFFTSNKKLTKTRRRRLTLVGLFLQKDRFVQPTSGKSDPLKKRLGCLMLFIYKQDDCLCAL